MINLSIPQAQTQLRPRITVVGVGGAGGNAVNNMIRSNLEGVEFLTANTDAQALSTNLAEKKLQLGTGITQGLGAGSRPEVGRTAAEEAIEEIVSYLEGSHMVFITAGLGGGTGTGAAPVIARAAREQGILTVGVVTRPFHFEGAHRMRIADKGQEELQQYVDTLIVIPNQNLFRIANERTTFADAFKMADDVLHSGVRGVTDLMVMPGLINLDFADIRTVMGEMGKAMMGTGTAEGENRAVTAAEAAISNPLLDDISMKGARGVLINITGGLDLTLYEVDEAANRIRDDVDPEANIIFGAIFDESMEGRVRVSVVATGIDQERSASLRPGAAGLHLVHSRPPLGMARSAALEAEPADDAAEAAEPATAEPAEALLEDESQEPMAAQAGRPAARRGERRDGGFIAPMPVEPAKRPRTGAAPALDDGHEAGSHARMLDPARRRAGNLFRRMTGLLRDEEAAVGPAPSPSPRPEPAAPARAEATPLKPSEPAAPAVPAAPRPQVESQARPAQPRLETSARGPLPRHEDESLDIPAFLRRQAN